MNHEKFEDLDQQLEKELGPLRSRRVPRAMLKGFSAAVEKKISEGATPLFPLTAAVPLLMVVFILMMLGALWFFAKVPSKIPEKAALPVPVVTQSREAIPVQVKMGAEEIPPALTALRDQDLILEIEVMQELGVWTDADNEEIGITLEDYLTVLEGVLESEILPSASQIVL